MEEFVPRIEGDVVILSNDVKFTINELENIHWLLNGYKQLARSQKRKLEQVQDPDAVSFSLSEIGEIRKALHLLDSKLPGYSLRRSIIDEVVPIRRRRKFY